jgi:spermidine synthase
LKLKISHASVIALLTGAAIVITQVVLLREFLNIFSGNELVIGVILCNWMLLTAAGAILAGLRKEKPFPISTQVILLSLLAVFPYFIVFFIDYLRNMVFDQGVMLSFSQIVFYTFVMIMPFCLLSGALFTVLVSAISENKVQNPGRSVYSFESFGSFIGGLLTGFLMIITLDSFQCMLIVFLLYMIGAIFTAFIKKKSWLIVIPASLVLLFILSVLLINPAEVARQKLYKGLEIVNSKDSPFGNITVTRQNEQYNIFNNGGFLLSTQQAENDEECIHFTLLQRPVIKKALIISGNGAGLQHETDKYAGLKVDFSEENPWLLDFQKQYSGLRPTDSFCIHKGDARIYLKENQNLYDAIIVNSGDPQSLLNNRFFTLEFFCLVKKNLSNKGIFSISLTSTAQYMGRDARALHSSLFVTLSTVFKNVIIIPGGRDYFLASDAPLRLDIAALSEQRPTGNLYVNSNYLDDFSLQMRNSQIMDKINRDAPLNKDFKPISNYLALNYWLNMSGGAYKSILIIAGLILLIPLFFSKTKGISLWATGFTGSSIEIILLLAYQSLYGHIYILTGPFFAVFMAGLAAGAFTVRNTETKPAKAFIIGQFVIAAWCEVIPLLLFLPDLNSSYAWIVHPIIFAFNFITAFLGGRQFALATRSQKDRPARNTGLAYSFDLLGAAAGALFISALILPMAGLVNVTFMIVALNLICGIIMIFCRKKL